MVLKLSLLLWVVISSLHIVSQLRGASGAVVGFNYGILMSIQPSPSQLVNLLKQQHITSLRLYDANSTVLQALAGTDVQVTLAVPNTQLLSVGESKVSAANWVKNNVLAYPNTNITGIVVGNEVLTTIPNAALVLVPAMKYLYAALVAAKLQSQVKITTPLSTSLILDSFPPSQAFFNKTWNSVLQPMFTFLSQTSSYIMLNVYTYDIYKASNGVVSLDYALLNPLPIDTEVVDSNTLLTYTNLFDAVLDSAFYALNQLNFSGLPIVVSETGWPHQGDASDTDATVDNASTYISNLIRHMINNTGTPKHPRTAINTFILELFDEDLKTGSATRRHYGLFNSSSMLPLYLLKLSGSGQLLSNDSTNQLYCVAKPGVDDDALQIALDWACGIGQANCTAIQAGNSYYEPDTIANHASYAFDSYYQSNGRSDGSCNFGGAAVITTTNPSYGNCAYPGSFLNSSAPGNSTRPASSSNNSTSATNVTLDSNGTASSACSLLSYHHHHSTTTTPGIRLSSTPTAVLLLSPCCYTPLLALFLLMVLLTSRL